MTTTKAIRVAAIIVVLCSSAVLAVPSGEAWIRAMKAEGLTDEQIQRIVRQAITIDSQLSKPEALRERIAGTNTQMTVSLKLSLARRILNTARQMDAAIDQWALEKQKKDGDAIDIVEAAKRLGGNWVEKDLLGNPYTVGRVGRNQLKIADQTKRALAGIGIDWGMF